MHTYVYIQLKLWREQNLWLRLHMSFAGSTYLVTKRVLQINTSASEPMHTPASIGLYLQYSLRPRFIAEKLQLGLKVKPEDTSQQIE